MVCGVCTLCAKKEPVRKTLSNGIQVVVQELDGEKKSAALRMLMKTAAKNDFLSAYDSKEDDEDEMAAFFLHCADKLSVACEDVQPEEVALVAVSSLPSDVILQRVEEQLGELPVQLHKGVRNPIAVERIPGLTGVAVHVSYLPHIPALKTHEDLQVAWKLVMLEQLGQNEQKTYALAHHCDWVTPERHVLLPQRGYIWRKDAESTAVETLLPEVYTAMARVRNVGVSESEFLEMKQQLLERLYTFCDQRKDPRVLLSYLCEQVFAGWNWLADESFLTASISIVEETSLDELKEFVPDFFSVERSKVAILLPKGDFLSTAILDANDELQVRPVDALPSPLEFYLGLPMSAQQQQDTYDIIETMAKKNVFELLFKKKTLEKKGKRVNSVHPLRFIGFIVGDGHLKHCLKKIKESSFKWDHFIEGFSNRMNEELHRDAINGYLPGFCEYLHVAEGEVRSYITNRDWEGLTVFLMHQ